jgi:DedD protein
MAEPGQDDQDGLKKKLVRRIAMAAVAAVVLLGGLALFENYLTPEPPAPAAPAPTAAAPAAQPAEAPKPEIKPAEEKKEEAAKPEEPKAEPEKTEMPLAPAPEPRPASRVVIKPPAAAPAAPAKKAATTRVEKVEPTAPATPVTPTPAAKPDPATVIARSYRLQMGVFTAASNAEELHAKLEKAGIPSYVESRVHVGPFRTQKEADEARRKLKELGLGPGLLIPPQKR